MNYKRIDIKSETIRKELDKAYLKGFETGKFRSESTPIGRELLNEFIKAIKDEFADENWDYLDFIADRVMTSHPIVKPKE